MKLWLIIPLTNFEKLKSELFVENGKVTNNLQSVVGFRLRVIFVPRSFQLLQHLCQILCVAKTASWKLHVKSYNQIPFASIIAVVGHAFVFDSHFHTRPGDFGSFNFDFSFI